MVGCWVGWVWADSQSPTRLSHLPSRPRLNPRPFPFNIELPWVWLTSWKVPLTSLYPPFARLFPPVYSVNVASRCGYTDSNYKQLQSLYEKYEKDGLQIFAMPTNEFGGQEPGSDADIIKFTKDKYAVTFPVFSKLKVNGGDASEIYRWLKSETKDPPAEANKDIKWNFTKVRMYVAASFSLLASPDFFLGKCSCTDVVVLTRAGPGLISRSQIIESFLAVFSHHRQDKRFSFLLLVPTHTHSHTRTHTHLPNTVPARQRLALQAFCPRQGPFILRERHCHCFACCRQQGALRE